MNHKAEQNKIKLNNLARDWLNIGIFDSATSFPSCCCHVSLQNCKSYTNFRNLRTEKKSSKAFTNYETGTYNSHIICRYFERMSEIIFTPKKDILSYFLQTQTFQSLSSKFQDFWFISLSSTIRLASSLHFMWILLCILR